jgi:hypothetical protein
MVRTRSSDKMLDIPIISAPTTSSPSQQEMERQLHAQMLLTNKASSMSQDALEKAQENSIQIQELNQKIEHMFQLQQEILTQLKSADTSSDAAASHRNHTRRPPIGTGNRFHLLIISLLIMRIPNLLITINDQGILDYLTKVFELMLQEWIFLLFLVLI